jgi:hypothetical protein
MALARVIFACDGTSCGTCYCRNGWSGTMVEQKPDTIDE